MPPLLKKLAAISFFLPLFVYSFGQPTTEKVYLHFDKPYYAAGDVCWYKAYVVNEDLNATTASGILYVDLIDGAGKIIQHQQLKIYAGEAYGDFSFNHEWPPGNYLVRAYTRFMRNDEADFFFYKSLFVYGDTTISATDSPRKIDLQFFPEGGVAVNHLPTQLAFKAIDATGKGINISAIIVDENNNQVGLIKSTHYGMGIIPYLPSPEKKYRVILNTGEQYQLPEASAAGVVMNVNNIHPDKIFVRIQSTRNEKLKLTGISRGKTVFSKIFETVNNRSNIEIPKQDIPGGICQLTIYSNDGVPKAERIVFIEKRKHVNIRIKPSISKIAPRDSVSLTIRATDDNGQPVETSLSVAITDAGFIQSDSSDANISTHLLLQSDLKGHIDHPAWLMQSANKYPLDLVMLTNGWRKYEPNKIARFKAEQQLVLKGKVIAKANDQPVPNANIILMMADIDFSGVYTTTSDSTGNFRIDSVDYSDSTGLVWQVRNEKGKSIDVNIILDDSEDIPPVDPAMVNRSKTKFIADKLSPPVALQNTDTSQITVLDTVEVVRRKRSYRTVGAGGMLVRPDSSDFNTMATTFLSKYALALPHLRPVENEFGETMWFTPGGGTVKMIIDGYEVLDRGPTTGNPWLVLNSFRTDELEYAIINGNNRNGYLIILQSKKVPNKPTPGIFKQKTQGYEYAKTFYHPKYSASNNPPAQDRRITLYWEPFISTDANGEAVISFYNSDMAKKFLVVVEGMAGDTPVTAATVIE